VKDSDGNPLAGIPVTFTVTGGGGTVSGNTPVTGSDGVAAVVEWRLGTATGENTLSAAVAGQNLSGGPVVFSATGTPGGVSAEQSTVIASPVTISASIASTITVAVRDQFGNPLSGVEVTLAASGSGNTLVQPSAPTNDDGEATGTLTATTVGSRTVSATAGGVAIEQTATVTVSAGVPSASTTTATVPNGRAGQPTTIEILLKDVLGNPVTGAANAIALTITGANNVGGAAAGDQGGGRYTVRYTPLVAGTDQVAIRVSGTALAGSPFTSQVGPGPANPATSTAGITASLFGVAAEVTARDAQGNPVGEGGETVLVSVDGGTAVTAEDRGDGTYRASIFRFSPRSVVITMNGVPIQGSPFTAN
jgi:adhesin/invasin